MAGVSAPAACSLLVTSFAWLGQLPMTFLARAVSQPGAPHHVVPNRKRQTLKPRPHRPHLSLCLPMGWLPESFTRPHLVPKNQE